MGEIADQIIDQLLDYEAEASLERAARQRWRDKQAAKCPACGRKPKATHTQFGWRRDCCGLWGWGKHAPLVSAETHQARQYAHKVFDSLWQSGLVDRSRAYALLVAELNLDPADCHMKLMDRETAERVPGAVHDISKRLRGVPT